MQYAPAIQMNNARHIAREAKQRIRTSTGMNVDFMLCTYEDVQAQPEQMLRVIASSLNLNATCYRWKDRCRTIVELRFVGALLLRKYYPLITLQQIGLLFGGQDHTSVINSLQKANNLLDTHNAAFTAKYNVALNSVNTWLRKEVSVYA